jgi:LytS/YehU family sensor histidine kinase
MIFNKYIKFKLIEIPFHILFLIVYLIYPFLKFGDHHNFEFDLTDGIKDMLLIFASVYTTYFLYRKFLKSYWYVIIALVVLLALVIVDCLSGTHDCNCSLKICFLNSLIEYIFVNIFFVSILAFKNYVLSQQALQKSEKERISAELKGLKAKVNPHFLFNTLNMLYANAISKDDGLPDNILQLSDNLHYMLHEGGKNKVAISKEVGFIKDYISLQVARTGKKNKVSFKKSIDNPAYLIPPLLLIPFIENAFKFSNMIKGKDLPITIGLKLLKNKLDFTIMNTYNPNYVSQQIETWKGCGVGIENTSKRLSLLYPNAHTLNIYSENNRFNVNLKIDLK